MSSHEALMEPPDTDSFKDEVFTPIGDEYEEYDPERDIRKLKELPLHERRKRALELKEKYTKRALGIGNLYKSVLELMYRNNDLKWEQVDTVISQICESYDIEDDIRSIVHGVFLAYEEKKSRIDDLVSRYPLDLDLFEKVFGDKPRGRVEFSRGPVSLMFKCHDPGDYHFALHGTWPIDKGGDTHKSKSISHETGGACLTNYSRIANLQGSILIMNTSKVHPSDQDYVVDHELQHAHFQVLKQSIFRYFAHEYNANEIAALQQDSLSSTTGDEFKSKAERYFIAVRSQADLSVQDEILAYMKGKIRQPDGSKNPIMSDEEMWGMISDEYGLTDSEQTILGILTKKRDEGGLYDYTYRQRKALRDDIGEFFDGGDSDILIEKVFIKGYKSLIARGILAYKQLFDLGFEHEEIIGILSFHSLKNWPGIVRRIIKTRSRKGKSDTTKS